MVASQNLVFLCPVKLSEKYRDRVWRKSKAGFNSQPVERSTQQGPASGTVPPPPGGVQGLWKMGAHTGDGGIKGDEVLISSSCTVSKTVRNWHQ